MKIPLVIGVLGNTKGLHGPAGARPAYGAQGGHPGRGGAEVRPLKDRIPHPSPESATTRRDGLLKGRARPPLEPDDDGLGCVPLRDEQVRLRSGQSWSCRSRTVEAIGS